MESAAGKQYYFRKEVIEMANFEGYERRIEKINAFLKEKGFASLDEARDIDEFDNRRRDLL